MPTSLTRVSLVLIFHALAFAQTPSSTSLIASPNPSNYGQPATLTATVTSGATGKVTFYDGVTILGVGTISVGQASIATVMLPSGNRKLRAYYQGDGAYAASSSASVSQKVIAVASLGLRRPITFPAPFLSSGLAVADFNGDHKQDLALVDFYGNSVDVYLGNGDGTFQSAVAYPAGIEPGSVVIADFNGDGFEDLAITNAGNLKILLGNGNGTFQPALSSAISSRLTAVAVGDFNGDGKADLVFADASSENLEIVLGNGDGTFGDAILASAGAPTMSVAVADFDGDGKADLVITYQYPGNVGVLLGNGDGTFQNPIIRSIAPSLTSVIVADFNGDGKPDIVAYAPSSNPQGGLGIIVLLGKGDGTLETAGRYFTGFFLGSVAVEDFNGDGIPDIAVTGNLIGNGSVAIMLGNGDGTFGNTGFYNAPSNLGLSTAGDFNGDGIPDLVITGSNTACVLLGGALPDLTTAVSRGTGFTQGQQAGAYTITVTNVGEHSTSGQVKMAATLSAGLTPTAIAGTGWSCSLGTLTCTRTDSVGAQASYSTIVITVNVENGSEASLTSNFAVSGGGESNLANDSITDTTLARRPTVTTFTATPNPSALSQSVTLTATVTTGASGRVEFYSGATLLGSALLAGGQSVFTTSSLPSGTGSLRADYLGDSNYGPSISAPQTQTVTTDAENGFVPYTSYSIPTGATWIGAADLNGDGVTDLITVNPYNVAVLLGNGDGTFRTPVSYSYGNTFGSYITNSGLIADLNNDGHPDVVVATSNGMFMLLGNGDGTFRPAILFTSSASYSSLVAADFNRDGNLDLACLGPGGILLYSGNGDGTFQPPITLPSSSNGYNFVTAADLNRDGKPDLVALNSNSQTVGVFLGNGDGTFQLLTSSVGVFSPMGLVVGDFNGDGVPDLALSYLWGAIVLPGNGDGTFKTGVQTALSGRATPDWYSLVAGDFNGDGKLDLAFGGSGPTGPPGVTVFFGNGDGSFRQGPFLPSDAASSTAIAVGDYNRDSKLDIALTANAPGTIDVYLGGWFAGLQVSSTHSGGLTIGQTGTYRIGVNNYAFVPTSSTVTVTDTLPSGLTATAMSGTGWACTLSTLTCTRSDALTIDAAYPVITLSVRVAATLLPSVIDNQVTVTYAGFASSAIDPTMIVSPTTTTLTISPSPAILGQQVTLTATVTPGAAGTVLFLGSAVALGSASVSNGQAILTTRLLPSGRQYLIATYSGDSTYAPSSSAEIYQTVSSAPANAFAPQASYLAGTTPWAIAAGDFNHDGRTDLVVTNYDGNSISVLPGNGDGTFGPHVDYPVGTAPTSVTVADFNGDGQPDIAVGNDSGPAVSILLGNPDGSFQPAVHFSTPFGSSSLAASDFNGDGKIDLATSGDYALTILLGNGDGTFQPGVIYDVTGALADFNLDGKVDIYSAANGILPGNGDGTFQSGSYSGYSFSARSIVAGDLNGDGKPDIVAADNFGNIVVILGNGDGTFRSAQYPAAGVVAMSVLLADVNGDGKLDVVALNNGSNNVSVLLGNGDGTLQSAIAYPVCQAQAAVSADFNGDGRTDIAITCPVSNNITVLLGLLTPTLTIASSHADPIAIGQAGATYSLTVANSGPGVTSGQLKVVDTLPAGLTATAIQGTGWTCTLATLTCTNSTPLAANASYSPIIVSVTPTTIGSGANQVAVSGGGAANATAYDPTTIVGPAIIQTTPPNLQFSVDGTAAQTAPQALNLAPGTHTIAVAATQSGTPGTQYVFTGWSDSGAASHTITVGATSATYTATFQTQYLLTTAAFPQSGGTVTPASGTYYDSGSLVTLTASTNSPLTFTGWSGATGTTNPLQITMNAPLTITAAFDIPGATCTMTGDATASITDVQFIVNEALGIMPANNDLNNDGTVNIADIQKVLDAALKLGCLH